MKWANGEVEGRRRGGQTVRWREEKGWTNGEEKRRNRDGQTVRWRAGQQTGKR